MTLTRGHLGLLVLACCGVLVGFFALTSAQSRAGTSNTCNNELVCIWKAGEYDGCKATMGSDKSDYSNKDWENGGGGCGQESINNKVNSLKLNMHECDTRFYADQGYDGHFVNFFSEVSGGVHEDPHLNNGGGAGPYNNEDWHDRISSHDVCAF